MALMIGALLIQGLVPGPKIAVEQPTLFWGLIASMWIGNLMLVVLNLPLIGIWVRLLMIPYYMLFPAIIAFSALGVFTVNFLARLWTLAALSVDTSRPTAIPSRPRGMLFASVEEVNSVMSKTSSSPMMARMENLALMYFETAMDYFCKVLRR
jgi:hypothetical protein